jgi:cobalt/nickel transport protein
MRLRWCIPVGLILGGLFAAPVPAHYNMLFPLAVAAKRGEPATFVYQWGHPFEHQLFDAPMPESVFVLTPDGKKADLLKSLEKVTRAGAEGKKVTAYRFAYTPSQRGDYWFVLNTPPIWMEEDKEFLQDTVKVVLHVQAQKGWDAPAGTAFELLPLTRPYGLQPGMVFQAQALGMSKPLPGALVEVERYNPTPPKELPPDEQITRTVKTDPNGIVTTTLTDPGWWSITAQREAGERKREGKSYPVRQRTTLWVYVADKPLSAPSK